MKQVPLPSKLELLRMARDAFANAEAFAQARERLQREIMRRGGDGRLRDVQAHLAEDMRTVLLYAEWSSDAPACASFALARPLRSEADFEPEFYCAQLLDAEPPR
jgi:hypothetical protein